MCRRNQFQPPFGFAQGTLRALRHTEENPPLVELHYMAFRSVYMLWIAGLTVCLCSAGFQKAAVSAPPTFYKDVLPILQDHCQSCHRAGEAAPMSLVTYGE